MFFLLFFFWLSSFFLISVWFCELCFGTVGGEDFRWGNLGNHKVSSNTIFKKFWIIQKQFFYFCKKIQCKIEYAETIYVDYNFNQCIKMYYYDFLPVGLNRIIYQERCNFYIPGESLTCTYILKLSSWNQRKHFSFTIFSNSIAVKRCRRFKFL